MSTADLNLNLTDEQLLVKQTAREFAESYLEPGVIERDDKSITPLSEIKEMGKLGFLGMMVPEEWNGSGMDTFSYVLAMEEISRIDASAGVIMSVNNSLVCQNPSILLSRHQCCGVFLCRYGWYSDLW